MNNHKLYAQAKKYIPSGVNSPVRAFKSVGGDPIFIKRGRGAYFWDESGKKYIDFCCSWGPLLFGHAPEGLLEELHRALEDGTSFGVSTRKEVEFAKMICSLVPSIEKVRLVSSGTEATMTAIRLARGYTGRSKILKIDGGYHGHVDSLLVKAGSGGATFGIPDSAGIPKELSKLTLSIPFNDEQALENVFKKHGNQLAAFILEPVPGNMGTVIPKKGYLKKVCAITKKYKTILIFDEVMSGFRLSSGGAQVRFGIKPDLTCLGKIVGGGFPLAAFGGKKKIMDCLAPSGPVYQAGTLSGNPIAVTAGLWMLGQVKKFKAQVTTRTENEIFFDSLRTFLCEKRLPIQLNAIGSMFTLFFTQVPVSDYASAKNSDLKKYARFFHECLRAGIYIAPSQFEANFISFAHTQKDLEKAARVIKKALLKA